MKRISICFLVLLLGGCASGYAEFYQPTPYGTPELIAAHRAAPPPQVPALVKTSDSPQSVGDYYTREGYVQIGYAFFTSGTGQSEAAALEQGKKVGADLVVILNPTYAGSVQGQFQITTPTTQTSYSTGTATAYGPNGPVTAYGSGTTTTYGSKTNYIPYTINRYSYGAGFFVKRKVMLGVNWRDLSDSERQQLQTNKGFYVLSLVNGSPAFNADVLPGDIVLDVDGESASSLDGYGALLTAHKGGTVDLTIVRNGQRIEKSVQLGQ